MLARTIADDITQENNLLLYLEITQSLANYDTIRDKLGGLQTFPEIGFVSALVDGLKNAYYGLGLG